MVAKWYGSCIRWRTLNASTVTRPGGIGRASLIAILPQGSAALATAGRRPRWNGGRDPIAPQGSLTLSLENFASGPPYYSEPYFVYSNTGGGASANFQFEQ